MLLSILPLSLFILSSFTGAFEIKQIDSNGAHLIETSPSNYAVFSHEITQNGWKTVSTNGDQISIIAPDCQVTRKTVQSLTDTEQNLITGAENQLSDISNNQGSQVSYKSSQFSTDGSVLQQKSRGVDVHKPGFTTNVGLTSISKSDENDYSIARPGLPMNLARIFIKNDVVIFVYLDGQVQMKPTKCLDTDERLLVERLILEIEQAEKEFNSKIDHSKDNFQINDIGLARENSFNPIQNNWDSMFVHPPLVHPPLIHPGMDYLNPTYNGFPRHQPINPVNLFHPPQHPIDNLAPAPAPAPALAPASYHGGPFNELMHDAMNGYNPIRTYKGYD